MKNFLRKKSGFTLLEVIIAALITILIMGTGVSMLITGNNVYNHGVALVDIHFQARKAINLMSGELHNTSTGHIYILDLSGNHVLNGNRLRFQVPVDYDADGDILDNWGHIEWGEANSGQLNWAAEYILSGTSIIRRVYNGLSSTATAQPTYETVLVGDVGALQFQGQSFSGSADNLALVEINLTTQRTTIKGVTLSSPLQMSLRSKVKFRN